MKMFAAMLLVSALLVPAEGHAGQDGDGAGSLIITLAGSQPSVKGPAEHFTGAVRIDSPFQAGVPGRLLGASVTFEPGARTDWHTHPLGQTLIVTSGCGLVQQEGYPIQTICPGDTVWIAPGVKHWHGAAPTTAMTHIAIVEQQEGSSADWKEKVTDKQYKGK